jgi:hypothetical protein
VLGEGEGEEGGFGVPGEEFDAFFFLLVLWVCIYNRRRRRR